MALRNLFDSFFQEEEVRTRPLVCGLAPKFANLLESDAKIYSRFYSATTIKKSSTVGELLDSIDKRYDIVHVLCDVSSNRIISAARGNTITGTLLIEKCCSADVKLLWIASENGAESYIKGFKAAGKRINLVMTISRNGPSFSGFLQKLLSKIAHGETMPKAWASLAPQAPGSAHRELPDCIFAAFRPDAKFR